MKAHPAADNPSSPALLSQKWSLVGLILMLCLYLPVQAHARDFAETNYYTLKYRQQIDDYLAGRMDISVPYNREQMKYMCGYVQSDFAATEMGKLKYNELFGEVENDEHARDIQRLNDALENEKDCKKRFRIWLAYDDKWYYEKRKAQDAKNKEQEKLWASQVVDTGADVWDGVINGTFFSIPRKYMWAGRNRPDGLELAINLLFTFPGMRHEPSIGEKGASDVEVVLKQALIKRAHPCPAHGKETCTRYTYQVGAWFTQYLDCSPKDILPDKHHALWRKTCKYKEGQKKNQTPVFDEEVGMWRIGEAGYYEGSPEFPTYWFICGKPGTDWHNHYVAPRCSSAVYVTDTVYAYYSFPQQQGFRHHREIHEQLQKKLRSFIVEPSKTLTPEENKK